MTLHIQDPLDRHSLFLLEAILTACTEARSGGGAFAFASRDGIRLLLEDASFQRFLAKGRFELVVGVNAVTDTSALARLREVVGRRPNLRARVFYNDRAGVIFHPKWCWFRSSRGGICIVGSGNLTAGGLRNNWEAYSQTRLNNAEVQALEQQWSTWIQAHEKDLCELDDKRVIDRAALNVRVARAVRTRFGRGAPLEEVIAEGELEESEETAPQPAPMGPVLVAEIPRGGGRWSQANFDLATIRGFFGAEPGQQHRIVLQHVNADGTLGELETRPFVAVQSQNYRFELEAGHGLAYPEDGRPFGVFLRTAIRTFIYRLMMPTDDQYATVEALLQQRWRGRADRMRRVILGVEELRQAWPDSPLWSALEHQPSL